jgi:hypothetical protein
MSSDSLASDFLEAVRDLAIQFPGLPIRTMEKFHGSVHGDYYEWENEYPVHGVPRETSTKTYRSECSLTSVVSRNNSLAKRKPHCSLTSMPPMPTAKNDSMQADADHEVSHCLHVMTLRLHVHICRCRLHSGLDPEESLVKTPATDPGQNLFIGDDATASTEYGGGSNVLVHRTARHCFEGLASESCRYQGLPQWGWTSAES